MLVLGANEQGGDVNLAELERVRHTLELDHPLYEQFFSWVWGIVRLDFGTTLWTGAPGSPCQNSMRLHSCDWPQVLRKGASIRWLLPLSLARTSGESLRPQARTSARSPGSCR